MKHLTRLAVVVATLLLCGALAAQNETPKVFDSEEQEARFKHLTLELRCLVCQNQNLADSDAPLAQDLRKEIFDMLQAGEGDEEIKTFMVERYGDFVLYRPPVQGNTLALWAMPVLFLFVGAIAVFVASGMVAKQMGLTRVGPEGISLKSWIYEALFASWAGPLNGSLAFAISYVLVWLAIMWILYRRRIFIKI